MKDHLERIAGSIKQFFAKASLFRHKPIVILDVPSRVQMDEYSCGLCSARMVAEYHGVMIPKLRIERFSKQNSDGTDTQPMVSFLRANRMTVQRHREGKARIATIKSALDKAQPVIVSIPGHYLVITGYDRKHFYVSDPSLHHLPFGRIARAEFRRRWTREALVVKKVCSRKTRR